MVGFGLRQMSPVGGFSENGWYLESSKHGSTKNQESSKKNQPRRTHIHVLDGGQN